jgi:hypothetical protein
MSGCKTGNFVNLKIKDTFSSIIESIIKLNIELIKTPYKETKKVTEKVGDFLVKTTLGAKDSSGSSHLLCVQTVERGQLCCQGAEQKPLLP